MAEYTEAKNDIVNLLHSWGVWSSSHGINQDYPNATPYRRMLGSGIGLPPIDDSEGNRIDLAISGLRETMPKAREVIALRYLYGIYLHDMQRFGFSRVMATHLHDTAVGWLICRLHG